MKSIAVWRNRFQGADIYVLGAGSSLDYLDKDYFRDKIVVAVNESASTWGITPAFVVLKEHRESLLMAAADFPDVPLIVSRHSYGDATRGFPPIDQTTMLSLPNLYVFDHEANRSLEALPGLPAQADDLVVSASTITSAMHFACYAGAKTVWLVGHDAGQLGDAAYVKGYGKAEAQMGYPVQNTEWLIALEKQSREVKRQLVERYGVRVWSVSPFISPDLEGVPFRGTNVLNMPAA